MPIPSLRFKDYSLEVCGPHGLQSVLRHVDLTIMPGQTLGLVGESGSGKSTLALAAMALLPPAFRRRGGTVELGGCKLNHLSSAELAGLRGRQVAMVWQDPGAALNPTRRIGSQLDEVLRLGGQACAGRPVGKGASATRQQRQREIFAALTEAGLRQPQIVARAYPHELSGGMRQRAMVAMALLGRPALLLADEPTTALDVTVQAEVLASLRRAITQRAMACLFVSHDLAVVAGMADEVAVLLAGEVVERAPVDVLFAAPAHPYTAALLQASHDLRTTWQKRPMSPAPSLATTRTMATTVPPTVATTTKAAQLHAAAVADASGTADPAGTLRSALYDTGCSYADRCPRADATCWRQAPTLRQRPDGAHGEVRCHHPLSLGNTNERLFSPSAAVFTTADAPPISSAPAAVNSARLTLHGLTVSYSKAPWRLRPFSPGLGGKAETAARRGANEVVQDAALQLAAGEVLALIGESGSGKSTLARAVLQLLPPRRGTVTLGQDNLTAFWRRPTWQGGGMRSAPSRALRSLRRRLQAMLQDPAASLDPRQTALAAVTEPLQLHQPCLAPADAKRQALALLAEVGLDASLAERLPHALSGGQRQRLALARALAPAPEVLVVDEPTSALDVASKGRVLQLLRRLTAERNLATLLVTHDLPAVRAAAERTATMLWGHVIEVGATATVLARPLHPYTQALVAAEPLAHPARQRARFVALAEQAGSQEAVDGVERGKTGKAGRLARPPGCPYHPRCPVRLPRCRHERPELRSYGADHAVACHAVAQAQEA